jgi:hypothetical protein
MTFETSGVAALEILDSRGRPTVQTTVTLSDGTIAAAGVRPAPPPTPERRLSCAMASPPGSVGRGC